jgi:hypothetical protein
LDNGRNLLAGLVDYMGCILWQLNIYHWGTLPFMLIATPTLYANLAINKRSGITVQNYQETNENMFLACSIQ